MASKWRKVKAGFGLNLCVHGHGNHVAATHNDDSKSFTNSSSEICSICLASMSRGGGQAIFTAECSHSFHFQCIASNVKHANQICPVCRAKWKEIPLPCQRLDSPPTTPAITPIVSPQNNELMTAICQLPPPRDTPLSRDVTPEPVIFNDDEPLDHKADSIVRSSSHEQFDSLRKVQIKTYTELLSTPKSSEVDNFTVLVHLKAPVSNPSQLTSRAPIDLVTVLDISGSMVGTKLALLKRAMGFVIQNLGPRDRLAVIAFSSTARRLFPLRRMSEGGRQQALLAVNSLVANGGTNIAEGLRKGSKIMEDRTQKNLVASIILLSDGKDTYTVSRTVGSQSQPNYQMLLPDEAPGFKIPVHAFGFGADHDASSMHLISEISGGTFSFIETESVIQDAFAQCIGGLLSVVVKDLHVEIECVGQAIRLASLKSGNYRNRILSSQQSASIDVGDLYADEERDFLVSINVPTETSNYKTSLLKARCVYKDPSTEEVTTLDDVEVSIERTYLDQQVNISIEVDRQRNRTRAAEAMAQAQSAAENGDLAQAVSILEDTRNLMSESKSAKSQDKLCISLDAELREMQERMESIGAYEASGRAYILSGLSSHSWQRATTRGDSTTSSSLIHAYQTPSMVEMVSRSQEMLFGSPSAQQLLRPVWSFATQPERRQ